MWALIVLGVVLLLLLGRFAAFVLIEHLVDKDNVKNRKNRKNWDV